MDAASAQINRTTALNLYLADVRDKLAELQNFSRISTADSRSASDMNQRIDQQRRRIADALERIRAAQAEVRACLDNATGLLGEAGRYLEEARDAYRDAEEELSRLDQAKDRMQVRGGGVLS